MIPFRRPSNAAERWPTIPVISERVWHTVGAGTSVAMGTVGLLASFATHEADLSGLFYFLLVIAVHLALWAVLRGMRWRWLLMTWPLAMFGGLAGATSVAPTAATLCASMMVLAFLFAGLTQRRGASLVLLVPALLTYRLVFEGLPLQQLWVKAIVAALVWMACTELPTWLTGRLRFARAELARLAATDPLTGLANRRRWDEQLTALIDRGAHPAVLLVDLDHFKRFNDEYGHLAGDQMLASFAELIDQNTRAGDVAARWGGEEFAVLLHDAAGACQVAERIRRAVPLSQTCSIGLVEHQPGETIGGLMRRADAALYRAKTGGRNRVVAA